jgi:hypothetical protein
MPQIVLTEEQSRIVDEATEPVEVLDAQGRLLTSLPPLSPDLREVLARHRARQGQPRQPSIPSAKVQEHLRRLHEIRQQEGLDEARMLELLKRMQNGEEV